MITAAHIRSAALLLLATYVSACGGDKPSPTVQAVKPASTAMASDALPADQTGGFDGAKAFEHVEKMVGFGPRPSGSPAIKQTQDYIRSQLKSFGCSVDEDNFEASTPAGRIPMVNIMAKISGAGPSVILLLTHYDTKRLANFVGANDAGSSTGLMLEMARLLCAQKGALSVWIAFLDGEEAVREWSETDSTYGSRQMAAKLALAGDMKKIKAVILADMIGDRNLDLRRESNSTAWLTDIVWNTAKRLGYEKHFLAESQPIEDDHLPFLKRNVPATDLIDFDYDPYWHQPTDTLDKISARSIGIVGHVILESVKEIEKRK